MRLLILAYLFICLTLVTKLNEMVFTFKFPKTFLDLARHLRANS